MNLNSWTRKDKARRLATLVSSFLGSCTFAIYLLDYQGSVITSLLLGMGSGALCWWLVYAIAHNLIKQ